MCWCWEVAGRGGASGSLGELVIGVGPEVRWSVVGVKLSNLGQAAERCG